jgi:hypothetical protein
MAGIRAWTVSGPAVGQSGEAKHRIKIVTINGLYTQDLKMQTMVLSLTGRLTMVKKGPSISLIEKGFKRAEHSAEDEVPILPFKIANMGCRIHV